MRHIKHNLKQVAKNLKDTSHGLSFSIPQLDKATRGMFSGQLIIVAGRSSMGKTALATDIALIQPGKTVIFSLEMCKEVLIERMISNISNVPYTPMKDGDIDEKQRDSIRAAFNTLKDRDIWIDDTSLLNPMQFRRTIEEMENTPDLIIIDYLQLMKLPGSENRTQELDGICQEVRAVCKEGRIPIVLVSQLSRKPDERQGHEPRLSDLRGSGGIEQTADIVLMLHRPSYYLQREIDFNTEDSGEAEIFIAKQRNGVTGKIKCVFYGPCMSFRELPQGMEGW